MYDNTSNIYKSYRNKVPCEMRGERGNLFGAQDQDFVIMLNKENCECRRFKGKIENFSLSMWEQGVSVEGCPYQLVQ
eukprot:Pgem_evm1s3389